MHSKSVYEEGQSVVDPGRVVGGGGGDGRDLGEVALRGRLEQLLLVARRHRHGHREADGQVVLGVVGVLRDVGVGEVVLGGGVPVVRLESKVALLGRKHCKSIVIEIQFK